MSSPPPSREPTPRAAPQQGRVARARRPAYVVAFGLAAAWLAWGPSTASCGWTGSSPTSSRPWSSSSSARSTATQLLRRLLERAAAAARPLLVGSQHPDVDQTRVAGHRRDPRVGGAADRQLGLHLAWPPPRGLALRDAARGRSRPMALVVDLFGIHLVPTLCGSSSAWCPCTSPPFPARTPRRLAGRGRRRRRPRRGRRSSWSPTPSCTGSLARGSRVSRWTPAYCGRGRDPNYFGEVSFWFALAIFGLATSPSDWWWIFVGAVAMLGLFEGISIPMMEQRSLERRPTTRTWWTGSPAGAAPPRRA